MSTSKETEAAATRLSTSFTDAASTLFNEPSLGLYYVVEHVQRAVREYPVGARGAQGSQ